MGFIDAIKSVFIGSDDEEGTRGSGDVTVEHEPDAASEAAVKGTDEPAAADTDAAASTGSLTEAPQETPGDEVAGAAEPAEAAGPTTQGEDEPAGVDAEADAATDLESISGIGEAYANRLREAGVDDVEALVAADAAAVADETGIGEARIRGWQERAGDGE